MEKDQLSNGDKTMDAFYAEARKRVAFKIHLTIYILVNLFIWTLWYLLLKDDTGMQDSKFKAILALSICWLIAVVFHYLVVYKWRKKMVKDEVAHLIKAYEAEHQKEETPGNDGTSEPEREIERNDNTTN